MLTEIVTGGIVLVTNVVSFVTGRKKYNSEVAGINIANIQKALDAYDTLNKMNTQQIASLLEECNKNRAEILSLKKEVTLIISDSCKKDGCPFRNNLTEDELIELTKDDNIITD